MKTLSFFFLFCFISPLLTHSQSFLIDNFSDGNFNQSPFWYGNDSSFIVNDKFQLQLNASTTGTAYLVTNISPDIPDIDWEFYVKMPFSPSSNNNARIALLVTKPTLDSLPDGIWIQLGEAGANDAIRLIARENQTDSILCSGPSGQIATSFAFTIKVSLIKNKIWKLYTKSMTQNYFNCQASALFPVTLKAGYFGILCSYTSSNIKNFFFDNISIMAHQFDVTPPSIIYAQLLPPSSISVQFSEPTDSSSTFQVYNYSIYDPPLYPRKIAKLSNENTYSLTFDTTINYGEPLPLHISYIYDKEGNMFHDTTLQLISWKLNCFDVLINEIMADPEPVVELPPTEYLELFNRSNHPINLDSWRLSIGTTIKEIPSFILKPKQHVIVISVADSMAYPNKVNTIYLKSLSLPNTGTTIALFDSIGNLIHSLAYTPEQHYPDTKKEGGWSLELIDPTNPCETSNWKSSIALEGGTPGAINSVSASNPDIISPKLRRSRWIDSQHFTISASESLDSTTINPLLHFSLTPPTTTISSIAFIKPLNQAILFSTNAPLDSLTSYTLTITDTISDCASNSILVPFSIALGKPLIPKRNNIIINEIITNPAINQTDYIELVNNSDKFLDLNKIILSYYSPSAKVNSITLPKITLNPYEYLLLSRKPENLKDHYNTPFAERLIACEHLPDFSSVAGSIVLSLANNPLVVIDSFNYSSELYPSLINSFDGVALERVNPLRATNEVTNWQPAATSEHYGTPGYLNSQYCPLPNGNGQLIISPKIFSPELANLDHSVSFKIIPSYPGSFTTLTIYNIEGRKVITLVNHELIGTENTYSWNGLNESGNPSPTGYYLAILQIYTPEGKTEILKEQVILTH